MKKNTLLALLLLIAVCFWSLHSYFDEGVIHSLVTSDIDAVANYINSFGTFAAIVFLLIVTVEVVVAPVPPFILYVVGSIIFGSFWAGTLALVGNVLGAIIAFYMARLFGKKFFEKQLTKKTKKTFDRITTKYGGLAIFFLRINPFTSSDIVSYLAGLTKMSFRSLFLGTLLGLAPNIYLQTYIGDDLIRNNEIFFLIFLIVSLAYIALLVFGGIYLSRTKR